MQQHIRRKNESKGIYAEFTLHIIKLDEYIIAKNAQNYIA